MKEKLPYTPEQITRLGQFVRAIRILEVVERRKEELKNGVSVIIFDRDTKIGHPVDDTERKMIHGAIGGIFNEAMDLGLKEEIKIVTKR